MANKMTQKDYYNEIIKALLNEDGTLTVDEMVEFIKGRLALLEKKSANRKPTKTQAENENVKNDILSALTAEGQTVSEIIENMTEKVSCQKASALLRQLIDEGKVKKSSDKKKSLFSLA